MATGGGDNLASQYVEFVAKGMEEIGAAMDQVKQGLLSVEDHTQQMARELRSVGGYGSDYLKGLTSASVDTADKLNALRNILTTNAGAFDAFVESAQRTKQALNFAESAKDVRESLAELRGVLKPDDYEELTEELVDLSQALKSKLGDALTYAEPQLRQFQQTIKGIGEVTKANQNIQDMVAQLVDPRFGQIVDDLNRSQFGENLAKQALVASEQLRSLKDQLAPDRFRDLEAVVNRIGASLETGGFAAAEDQLRRLQNALEGAIPSAKEFTVALAPQQVIPVLSSFEKELEAARDKMIALAGAMASGEYAEYKDQLAAINMEMKNLKEGPAAVTLVLTPLEKKLQEINTDLKKFGAAPVAIPQFGVALAPPPVVLGPLQTELAEARQKLELLREQVGSGEWELFARDMAAIKEEMSALKAPAVAVAQELEPLAAKLKEADEALALLREQVESGAWQEFQHRMQSIRNETELLRLAADPTKNMTALMASASAAPLPKTPDFLKAFPHIEPELSSLQKEMQAATGKLIELKEQVASGEWDAYKEMLAEINEEMKYLKEGPAYLVPVLKQASQEMIQLDANTKALSGTTKGYEDSLVQAKAQLYALQQALASGTYQKHATEMAAIKEEMEGVQKAAHWQDLVAQHGRFGASLVGMREHLGSFAKAGETATQGLQQGLFRTMLAANLVSSAIQRATGSLYSWVQSGGLGDAEDQLRRLQNALEGAIPVAKEFTVAAIPSVPPRSTVTPTPEMAETPKLPDLSEEATTKGMETGQGFIQGIVNGMKSAAGILAAASREAFVGSVIDPVKSLLGIASPSKLFTQYGQWIMEGLALGIRGGAPMLALLEAQMRRTVASTRAQIDAFRAAIESGQYARHAAEMNQLVKEMEHLQKAAHWQDLVAQHGRFGASLVGMREHLGSFAKAGETATQGLQQGLFRTMLAANLVSSAIQRATGSLYSWVQSGMQGTIQGHQISMMMQLISREIASIFLPMIDAVVRGLTRVYTWLHNLSGAQQDSLMHWAQAGAAMLVVSRMFPMLIGGMLSFVAGIGTMVIPALLGMGTALDVATAGLTLILKAIAFVVSAAVTLGVGFAVGTATGRSALRDLWESLKPIRAALYEMYQTVKTYLAPVFIQVSQSIGEILRQAGPRLAAAFREVLPDLQRILVHWGKIALEFIPKAVQFAVDFGVAFVKALPTILRIAEALGRAFMDIAQGARFLWDMVKAGEALTRTLRGGLLSVLGELVSVLQKLDEKIKAMSNVSGKEGGGFGIGTLIPMSASDWFATGLAPGLALMNRLRRAFMGDSSVAEGEGVGQIGRGVRKDKAGQDHRQIMQAGGQFEDVQGLWKRLMQESMKSAVDTPELKEAKRSNILLEEIAKALGGAAGQALFGVTPTGKGSSPMAMAAATAAAPTLSSVLSNIFGSASPIVES